MIPILERARPESALTPCLRSGLDRSYREALAKLADCLAYPGTDALAQAQACIASLPPLPAATTDLLQEYLVFLESSEREDIEEYYTRSFDLSPVCYMYAGYQLYGEEYTRGALMAGLRTELKAHDMDPTPELPDQLSVLIKLFNVVDAEKACSLRDELLLPALNKMRANLAKARNKYLGLFEAINDVLELSTSETPVQLEEDHG